MHKLDWLRTFVPEAKPVEQKVVLPRTVEFFYEEVDACDVGEDWEHFKAKTLKAALDSYAPQGYRIKNFEEFENTPNREFRIVMRYMGDR